MTTPQMIEPRHLRPGTVPDLTIGSVLCSLGEERGHFLGGHSAGPVAVELDTMQVAPSAEWSRPPGYLISGIHFVVDLSSAVAGSQEAPIGSILLMADRLALYAGDQAKRYLIAIDTDNPIERELAGEDLVFPRWQIRSGTGDDSILLYEFGGVSPKVQREAARGPADADLIRQP